MTLDENISALLTTSATLQPLIGDRAYQITPAGDVDAPFIVWQEVTAEPSPTHDTFGTDLVFLDYQFACWAQTPAAAKAIRRALATVISASSIFAQAVAQSIGSSIQDPATRLHQSILQVRIPSSL